MEMQYKLKSRFRMYYILLVNIPLTKASPRLIGWESGEPLLFSPLGIFPGSESSVLSYSMLQAGGVFSPLRGLQVSHCLSVSGKLFYSKV